MTIKTMILTMTALSFISCSLVAVAETTVAIPVTPREQAIVPEHNPPGDISDSQVFIVYSKENYSLQVPEGWAKTERAQITRFVDKYDGVQIEMRPIDGHLSMEKIKAAYEQTLKEKGRAIKISNEKPVKIDGKSVIKIAYSSNSEPNPVTNKQLRLENESYLFIKNDQMAILTLWAPYGADNQDQWQLMSTSFRWK